MNNIVECEVTATPETALKKLSKANIAVYKLKKSGSKLRFGIRQEYLEKVFAIFKHPCYNIKVKKQSRKMRFTAFIKRRFGIAVGAVAFTAIALSSGSFVFRIKVVGNGSYLYEQIISIAAECGAREWSLCRGLDAPMLQAKVMALPSVNFCTVQRAGAFLLIDVHAEEDSVSAVDYEALKSNAAGEIYRIVAVCGTPLKAVGDAVSEGDELIGAFELDAEGERKSCLAVGFAEISVKGVITAVYPCESDENTAAALKSAALYSDRVIESSYTVKPCDGGVTYEVSFTYLKTVSINME